MPLFCRTGKLGEEKNKEKNPSELVEGQEEGSFPQMLKGSQRKTEADPKERPSQACSKKVE